jgi:hypothetical protein
MAAMKRSPGSGGALDQSHRPPRCSHQRDPAVEVWVLDARRRNPSGDDSDSLPSLQGRDHPGAIALGATGALRCAHLIDP